MVRKKSYISRNFPPREEQGWACTRAKFHPTPNSLLLFCKQLFLDHFLPSRVLCEDVVTREGSDCWRPIKGGGEWCAVAWSSWIFVLMVCQAVRHGIKIIRVTWHHCSANSCAEFLYLFSDVSQEGIRAPPSLEHNRKSWDLIEVHSHRSTWSDGVASNFVGVVAKTLVA
jgi:hypothetical protein